jgi:diguanylate cyclase (GGDEF)-like protein/PAS domain S-box-containing protein
VWRSGQPLWIADIDKDSRAVQKTAVRDFGLHGALFFPVLSEGKTIGVLAFNSREIRQPEARLLQAIRVIGSQIGQFLQRKQAEEVRRESEARFRSLTELSSDMYWEQDDQYRFTKIATPYKRLLGMRRWEGGGCFNMTEADWAAHKAILDSRQSFRDLELGRVDEKGEKVWASISGEPVFDACWAFTGYRGVAKDITGRKRAEQLRDLEHAVSRGLAGTENAHAGLRAAIRAVCETESWDCGRYFRVDEQAGMLRFADAWGVPDPAVERFISGSRGLVYLPGAGLSGQVWQSGQPLWSTDVGKDPRSSSGSSRTSPSHEIGIHGTFVFPVVSEGKTIGVLNFASRKPREPEESLLQAIHVIGSQIGQFMQRKQAEEVRRESEERFRSLTGLSSDWYWEQDENFRFTLISNANKDKTGRGPSSNLGRTRWDLPALNMSEADWAAHRALLEAHQPFYDLELHRRTADGKSKYTCISGEPMFDAAGAFKGYRGIGRDITARKREELLRNLEHTVTRCLSQADSVSGALKESIRSVCEAEGWECGRFYSVDEKAKELHFLEAWGIADPAVQSYIAASRERVLPLERGLKGRTWQTREPQWAADTARHEHLAKRIMGGARDTFMVPVIAEDRVIGILCFTSREVREPDARLLQAARVIGSQIGQFLQRKQAEEVRRESEERFRSLTKLSSDFYWETDAGHRMLQTEYAGQHQPVIPRGQRFGKARWEMPSTYPDAAGWAAHRATLEAHLPFRDFELARVDDNGVERYLSISGEPMFDAEAHFKGYRGVGKDITPRKQAEKLRELEQAVNRRIAEADSASAGIRAVIRAVCEAEGWDCGRYFRVDESAGLLRFNDAWGAADEAVGRFIEKSRGLVFRPGVGLSGHAWQSGRPLRSTDVEKDSRSLASSGMAAQSRPIGMRGVFVFPVVADGKTIGVLNFGSRKPREPDERLLEVISAIGGRIGQFVQRKQAEERQAVHARFQEKIARFGAAALGKRERADLVEDALQSVIEALPTTVTAYIEPGAGERELVTRGLAGAASGGAEAVAVYAGADAVARVLERGEPAVVDGADAALLPFEWARAFHCAALVPVHGDSRVQGVLCVLSEGQGAFGQEESKFLMTAAAVLSAGLRRIDSEGRLAFLAQFDPLTGLPNRALLSDRFSQMIVRTRRHGSALGVLFIDLDDFKLVNDTLGHAGGDELLKEAARRLQSAVRPGDTVARISGDEFAVILADLARADDAALVAQKIIDSLAAPFALCSQELFVTASIGIATCPPDGDDAETLLAAADAAMYRAKQSGRNAYQFFTADIDQRTRARAQLGSELRRALERGEFALAYQPKFDLHSGRPCAAEALLRWRHPERGPVPPVEFIPVLEETGLIVAVGEWVLRRACKDLKAWMAAGLEPMPVAVNLSARQFRQQDLDAQIRAIVRDAGVAPELIELEITESQLMHDPDHAARVIRSLADSGFRVAIDDFGTGYSSLSYLTRFPVAALKIDRSFVADVLSDRADAAIVRAVIDMAHTLGFLVVAEGVETEAQVTVLRGLGCEQAQGYFFAKPMPEAELRALLSSETKRIDEGNSPAENRQRQWARGKSARPQSGR